MTPPQQPSSWFQRAVPVTLGALVVAVLWLLVRPYTGVRHDGVLYTGQLLLQLYPDALSRDIFFAYGSQDRYSIFSILVSRMCLVLGFVETQFCMLVASLISFMVVQSRILRPLPFALDRWMALAAVAALSHLYGGLGIFAFAETFVTARTVAEPLALAALAAVLAERLPVAGILLILSFAVHPLIALPALVVAWTYQCLADRRWLWALPLVGVPPLLALMGIAPFNGLFRSFDAAWWAPVEMSNQHVFLFKWELEDWQIVAFDAAVLLLAMPKLPQALCRLCRALLTAGLVLMLVAVFGADLSRNVLLSALQTWRVLWMVHLFGLALLPFVVRELWAKGTNGRLAAGALALALVAINGRLETGWFFLAWAAALTLLAHRSVILSAAIVKCAGAVMVAAAAAVTLLVAHRTIATMKALDFDMEDVRVVVLLIASSPAIALPLAALLFAAWQGRVAARTTACAVIALAMAFGLATWDRRSEWVRHVESSMFREHPFSAYMPPTAQVYWPSVNTLATWLMLKRPSYVSYAQGAGLLFNRETAIEFSRRARVLILTGIHAQVCRLMAGLSDEPADASCPMKPEMIADFCQMDRGPDFMVLEQREEKGVVASWRFDGKSQSREFFLYDCKLLRTP